MIKVAITSSTYDNHLAVIILCVLQKYSNCDLYIIKRKKQSFKELLRKYNFMIYYRLIKNKLKVNLIEKELIKQNGKLDSLYCYCQKKNINVIDVDSFINPIDLQKIKKIKPDVIINCGGGIFRSPFIEIPKIGIINAHMGLLPNYRGMNVLEWSILNNDPIGVTLHYIDEGIDTGDIIKFKEIKVTKTDTIKTLRQKSNIINVELITEYIDNLTGNRKNPRKKQKIKDGKQYYKMSLDNLNIVESKIKEYV